MELTEYTYALTDCFPKQETFGLALQLRRSVVAVATNIADGTGQAETKSYVYNIGKAIGSVLEAETLIGLSKRLSYIPENVASEMLSQTSEIAKMLYGLKRSLQNKIAE
jgi:four helix bundle protein